MIFGSPVKGAVRAEAARRGLAVADKPDSHDVCFIADGDTRGFLTQRLGSSPGQIPNESGPVVGNHEGAFAYTVGQRRGLRIGHPAGDGRPRYVLDISAVDNTVTVGPAERLDVDRVEGLRPLWWEPVPEGPLECTVQMRAHGDPVPAVVELEQGRRLVVKYRV
jgi:tRNA-specific 2-thiouridylase